MLLKLLGTVLFTWILLVEAIQESRPSIHHRTLLPGHSEGKWILRGYLEDGQWTPVSSFREDLAHFASSGHSRDPRGLYQVALERPGDKSSKSWDLASIKAVSRSNLI